MRAWTVTEKVLAAVAAVVFVAVVALGVTAWRSDDGVAVPDGCEGGSLDSDLEADDSPTDALRRFVQARPETFPVDGSWVVESVEDGTYRFVSDQGGRYEVEVAEGLVRRFLSCPDSSGGGGGAQPPE